MRWRLASLPDRLTPGLAMELRAIKNRRHLFGLHGPPSLITDLIPRGSVVVDAGAASGLYSYFFARRAAQVHAFEPNPFAFNRLARGAGPRVKVYPIALSDREGQNVLHIPVNHSSGEASLERHSERPTTEVVIRTKPLDAFGFDSLRFMKIDVEGHEAALLDGARETITTNKPTIFIEVEERHRPGSVAQVSQWFSDLGYQNAMFLREGQFRPLAEFNLERDQLAYSANPADPRYSCNFLYVP